MNKSRLNKGNMLYVVDKAYEEIYDNIKLAVELIEEGQQETALDILKAVAREVGGE